MLERGLEILVRTVPEEIFGPGWVLRAQQLGLNSGRIDLLFADSEGNLNLVELKKGRASLGAVDQVLRYAEDLNAVADAPVVPWVLAQDIPKSARVKAESLGVRVKSLPMDECDELIRSKGIEKTRVRSSESEPTAVF